MRIVAYSTAADSGHPDQEEGPSYRLRSAQEVHFLFSSPPRVLDNHKQLWNDARSSAELDKFKHATQVIEPSTPVARKRARSSSQSPAKTSPKAKKNKSRRARQKSQLQKAKAVLQNQSGKDAKKPARDERVPAKEWQQITAFKYSGPRRCPFFNCSLGCRFGDQRKQKHSCVECGKDHPWHGNH